jgi:chaperonin cofactor prefoldin
MKVEFNEKQLDAVILHKVGELLFDKDLEKLIELEIQNVFYHVDFKYKARIDALEHKLEALSRNMDALYPMINSK